MDEYFAKSNHSHKKHDLHLVGVTSIFIACKYEEIYPVKLKTVYEKIGHKKIPI